MGTRTNSLSWDNWILTENLAKQKYSNQTQEKSPSQTRKQFANIARTTLSCFTTHRANNFVLRVCHLPTATGALSLVGNNVFLTKDHGPPYMTNIHICPRPQDRSPKTPKKTSDRTKEVHREEDFRHDQRGPPQGRLEEEELASSRNRKGL